MIEKRKRTRNTIYILHLIIGLFGHTTLAQDVYTKSESVDVQHYLFKLHLNDDSNTIKGEALITANFKDRVENFTLDLVGKSGENGMEVTAVYEDSVQVDYRHANDKITITPKSDGSTTKTFRIHYQGIAERGLVIDTTKFGQRSFFGDNWPNLARYWLPSVDHPYDKASVEFRITAPDHYDVVATGAKIEESNLGNGYKLTTYREPAPVAMKVVTIGVTRFASKLLAMVGDIPVTAWVYPENRMDGFSDYAVSTNVLTYFVKNIGPYPYAKLANMQAKTQWGGLENAGTISYFENSVTGKNTVEPLIAHEIAHQWFGNSASEKSWNHVWLSEGFATYFAILYLEDVYGDERRKQELSVDRKQVIDYFKKQPAPIVDPSIKDPFKVLSTNTYQKGGWVLNMLRRKLGNEIFWEGIRTYYETFQHSNAMTDDFQKVMEEISGQNLKAFFTQWVFTEGHPEIKFRWTYKQGKLRIVIDQLQEHHIFQFPLEIGIVNDSIVKLEAVQITKKSETFELDVTSRPTDVILDPAVWLLFEEK